MAGPGRETELAQGGSRTFAAWFQSRGNRGLHPGGARVARRNWRRVLLALSLRGFSLAATAGYTPAGTFAFARISRRSSPNSEIVRVTTVATGRALRPVASVFDTITTLSM